MGVLLNILLVALAVLKFILIALGIVLALLLILLLIVLLAPVVYRGEGGYQGQEGLYGHLRVYWLLGALQYRLNIRGNQRTNALYLFGFRSRKGRGAEREAEPAGGRDKAEAEAEAEAKTEGRPLDDSRDLPLAQQDNAEAASGLVKKTASQVSTTLTELAEDEKQDKEDTPEDGRGLPPEEGKSKQARAGKKAAKAKRLPRPKSKLRGKRKGRKTGGDDDNDGDEADDGEKKGGFDKIKDLYHQFLYIKNHPDRNRIIKLTLRLLRRLWRHLEPSAYEMEILFGLEDPSQTGMLLGAISAVKPLAPFAGQLRVVGDFDKKTFYAKGRLKGWFTLWGILWPLCLYVLSRPIWRIIKKTFFVKKKKSKTKIHTE